MGADRPGQPTERIARTFPLSEWAALAKLLGDGAPLPQGVDWEAYTVELVDRLLTDADNTHGPGEIVSQHLTYEGAEDLSEYDEDGELIRLHIRGGRSWRHVRTVIRHPDVPARLQWEWTGKPFGSIAIVGLEDDPDPERSARILLKAIQLLRDDEWRGEAQAGRPELTDDDVRHDLEMALEECRRKGWERPTVRQLAEWHSPRYGSRSETVGISERALRDRMRMHPQPFRELVPWIELPKRR